MRIRLVGLIGVAALASGCAASLGDGPSTGARPKEASVTRFHLGGPIARGEINVEPLGPIDSNDPAYPRIVAAVEAQLRAQGWTVSRGNPRSEQVALVRLEQTTSQQLRGRSGVSIGFGLGGLFGGRRSAVGVGGGASIPIGGYRRGQIVASQLSVRLQRRSDGTAIWEGRAEEEAGGGPATDPGFAAERLAPLLFRGFPGESGRTIRVR